MTPDSWTRILELELKQLKIFKIERDNISLQKQQAQFLDVYSLLQVSYLVLPLHKTLL